MRIRLSHRRRPIAAAASAAAAAAMAFLAPTLTVAGPAAPAAAQGVPTTIPPNGGSAQAGAPTTSTSPAGDAGQIQILDVTDGTDGTVTLEVALPPEIKRLAPVAANFGVAENGRLAEIQVSEASSTVDVMLVLDTSGSMKGKALLAAKAAATSFIRQLPEQARVGVIGFGDTAAVAAPPGTAHQAALDAVAKLEAKGETALWESLVLAARTAAGLGSERPYVVLLSDGASSDEAATQNEAMAGLTAAGAGLYAVAIQGSDYDPAALRSTVETVGGQFATIDDVAQLDALYTSIAGRLASRYVLIYRSDPTVARDISVSVDAGEAVATARTSLAASAAAAPAGPAVPNGAPPLLESAESHRLTTFTVPAPGLFGSRSLLAAGLAMMFGAFLALGLLITLPSRRIDLQLADGVDRVSGLNNRLSSATDRFLARRDASGDLDRILDAAGLSLRPGELVLGTLVATLTLALLATLAGGLASGLAAAVLCSVGVIAWLNIRANRRRRAFADQLVDALSVMAGGLRAGRGLPHALELVAEEVDAPMGEEFRRILFEARVGRDLTESMMAAARKMQSEDLEWVARAVDVNRELGGDLVEVLNNVAGVIRDRRKVARQVRSLSAEGRATGWVLLALPVVMFLFLTLRSPEFAGLLTGTGIGLAMLGLAVAGMLVGYLWIRKLVDIKY